MRLQLKVFTESEIKTANELYRAAQAADDAKAFLRTERMRAMVVFVEPGPHQIRYDLRIIRLVEGACPLLEVYGRQRNLLVEYEQFQGAARQEAGIRPRKPASRSSSPPAGPRRSRPQGRTEQIPAPIQWRPETAIG